MKKAVIVTFTAKTRMVIEAPDGSDFEHIQRETDLDDLASKARNKMQPDLENYLILDNMDLEEDTECPAKDEEDADIETLDLY